MIMRRECVSQRTRNAGALCVCACACARHRRWRRWMPRARAVARSACANTCTGPQWGAQQCSGTCARTTAIRINKSLTQLADWHRCALGCGPTSASRCSRSRSRCAAHPARPATCSDRASGAAGWASRSSPPGPRDRNKSKCDGRDVIWFNECPRYVIVYKLQTTKKNHDMSSLCPFACARGLRCVTCK